MQPESLMLYKLIVLYILNRVDFPISNAQLADIVTSHNYTTYFNIQEVISDLIEDNYILLQQTKNAAQYRISEEGRETLSFFYHTISPEIRDEIDLYLSEKQYDLREEASNIADYYEVKANEYQVELKVLERESTVIELRLLVPTKEDAETICAHWRKRNADVYAYVLSTLLTDSSEEK